MIGLILFLCFQKTTPVRAKAIGKWALIGFIVGVALSILSGGLYVFDIMMNILRTLLYIILILNGVLGALAS